MDDPGNVREALRSSCIADNTVLVNLVHAGAARLLRELLDGPVLLSPTILDPAEATLPSATWQDREPTSEFLRPLHRAAVEEQRAAQETPSPDLGYYRRIAPLIHDFASRREDLWVPLEVTEPELARAAYLASRGVREEAREHCEHLTGRVELDDGEAEVIAIASARRLTILLDDQAAVRLAKCLHPDVSVVRTCELLRHAATEAHRPCTAVSDLFNRIIVSELRFYAQKRGKRLVLRCDPPRCVWTPVGVDRD